MSSKLTSEVWPISNTSVQPGVENEDSVLIYQPSDPGEARFSGCLYVVAACQGGGGRGHVQTAYAARKVMAEYYASDEPDLGLRLENALQAANLDLFTHAQQRPELVKPAVSLTAVAVRGEAMSVAWVGDSRAYLIREGKIQQLTRDHTLVRQLLDEGALTPDEARDHPRRETLLRALGAQETVAVEVDDHRLRPDDALVLCTSTMLKAMDDEDIATVVASKSPQNAAEMLVQQARALGSKDTITVIAALLRDGAPAMVSNVPFTWDRQIPSFDQQATLAMPRDQQAPPQPDTGVGATLVSPRIDRASPAAQTQVSARPSISPQDLQEPPQPPASMPAPYPAQPPAQPPVQPAPPYQGGMQPAQSYPPQPVYPPQPPVQATPPAYQGYPPQPPAYRPGGQQVAPPGYGIDPVTGLPPVPQPGQPQGWGAPQQPLYQPRYYQPPGSPNMAAARRGPSIGVFALVGALAILLTALMVVFLINPFNFELPSFSAQPSQTPPPTLPPTVTVVVPVVTTAPPAGISETAVPLTPTAQSAPPGMKLVGGGAFSRGVGKDEAQAAILSCIDEAVDNKVCLPDYFTDAEPVADVTISPFYMDVTEVTNRAYAACVAAGVCTTPKNTEFYNDPAYADHPVVFVNWEQSGQFCQWAGKRLPYEAEWEKAARWDASAKHSNIWPWGDTFDPGRANVALAGQKGTVQVGKFAQDLSPSGMVDMAGNVSEWTLDWYFKGFAGLPTLNPTGPANQPLSKPFRVVHGGSFQSLASYSRAGQRYDMPPQTAANWIGFRCVVPLQGPVPTQPSVPTSAPVGASPSPTPTPTISPTPKP